MNTFLLLCGSKGKRLVINSSYHTYISFILSPLPYSIIYPSWFVTSYSRPSFLWCQCGHTIDELCTHLFWCLCRSEHTTTHDTLWDIIAIVVLESGAHVQWEVSHLFLYHTRQRVDILIIINDFRTLMDIVIANSTCTNMV